MGRAGKQVIQEGSDEDDIHFAQRKRKVAEVLNSHVVVAAPILQCSSSLH
jgi:hypothetical protein